MSTTTAPAKPKAPPSISAQLAKLNKSRDAARAKAHEARDRANAYDAETEEARAGYTAYFHAHPEQASEGVNGHPLPGTQLARMRDEVRKRMTDPNPHRPDHEIAHAAFTELDAAYQQFRRTHIGDLLAELDPAYHAARDEITEGFAAVVRGCDRYQEAVDKAREIICATPGLDGQALGHDGRPNQWKCQALDALESEIAKPGLTPNAAHKVAA